MVPVAAPRCTDIYTDLRERLGREAPIRIRAVREATEDEIELWTWHHNRLKAEAKR